MILKPGFAYQNNQRDHWLTPPKLIEACGPFDLDPCAYNTQPWPTAEKHYALPKENGLLLPWSGCVWCNPPYGPEIAKWTQKMALHGNGLFLIFARTDTRQFRDLWKWADGFLFFYGRFTFHRPDGTPASANSGAPSVVVAFGKHNVERLERAKAAGFDGALVTEWKP